MPVVPDDLRIILRAWSSLEGQRPRSDGMSGGLRGDIPWPVVTAWMDEEGIVDREHRREIRSLLRALDDEARTFDVELRADAMDGA